MKKYIKRDIEKLVLSALKSGFIAAILGARQTGKTTLMEKLKDDFVKGGFPQNQVFFFNFDDVLLRQKVASDFYFLLNTIEKKLGENLESAPPLIIFIDEAQKVPDVFELVKIIHDAHKQKIKIILSGSSSLDIQKKSAESLAGRIQHFYLCPLSISEVLQDRFSFSTKDNLFQMIFSENLNQQSLQKQQAQIYHWPRKREFETILERLLLNGGLPAVWQNPAQKNRFFKSLAETYLEKDIRSLKEVGNLENYSRLLRLMALEIGSLANISNLSQASGLAVNTLKKYQSILVASFIINKLTPLTAPRKRFVKSPKIYFFDTGMANYLAGREEYQHILAAKIKGVLFENLLLKSLESFNKNNLQPAELSFWRDYQGHEIDFVIRRRDKIIPIEVSFSSQISSRKKRNFVHFFKHYQKAKSGLHVFTGELGKVKVAGRPIYLLPWWLWW